MPTIYHMKASKKAVTFVVHVQIKSKNYILPLKNSILVYCEDRPKPPVNSQFVGLSFTAITSFFTLTSQI